MIRNFTLTTDKTIKLQLFQVYVVHENKKQRFHMQVTENGSFRITDPTVCPQGYLALEAQLSAAILANRLVTNP